MIMDLPSRTRQEYDYDYIVVWDCTQSRHRLGTALNSIRPRARSVVECDCLPTSLIGDPVAPKIVLVSGADPLAHLREIPSVAIVRILPRQANVEAPVFYFGDDDVLMRFPCAYLEFDHALRHAESNSLFRLGNRRADPPSDGALEAPCLGQDTRRTSDGRWP